MSKAEREAQAEARAAKVFINAALHTLKRSERGWKTLIKLTNFLESGEVQGLDSEGRDAINILVQETLKGHSAWVFDVKTFSPK